MCCGNVAGFWVGQGTSKQSRSTFQHRAYNKMQHCFYNVVGSVYSRETYSFFVRIDTRFVYIYPSSVLKMESKTKKKDGLLIWNTRRQIHVENMFTHVQSHLREQSILYCPEYGFKILTKTTKLLLELPNDIRFKSGFSTYLK